MSDTGRSDAVGKTLEDLKGVGDAARQVGGQAMQAGADAVDQAKDVAHDAKARAGSVASAIGEQASSAAEAQKSGLADKLEDVAKAVHRSGEQLEGHQDWVAHLVERGAAELSSMATTLRKNDLQGLLGELGSLARRQPAHCDRHCRNRSRNAADERPANQEAKADCQAQGSQDPCARRRAERCAMVGCLVAPFHVQGNVGLQGILELIKDGAHLATIESDCRSGVLAP